MDMKRQGKWTIIRYLLPVALIGGGLSALLLLVIIPAMTRAIIEEKKKQVVSLVDVACNIAREFYEKPPKGVISEEQSKAAFFHLMAKARYGRTNEDYFWVQSLGRKDRVQMLSHPFRPDLLKINLYDFTDATGRLFVREIDRDAHAKGRGFIQYMWYMKSDPQTPTPKLAYFRVFEPWGIVIATGVYLQDVRAEIDRLTIKTLLFSGVFFLFMLGASCYAAWIGWKTNEEKLTSWHAFQESEKRFRDLFELSPDAIILLENGVFTNCNDACVRLFRASNRSDLIGSNPATISPPTQPGNIPSGKLAEERMATAFHHGFNRFEWTHRRLDGEDFPTEVLLVGIQKEGKMYLHAVMRDISDRKKAEQAFRESEKRYRDIFGRSPDAMTLLENGSYTDCNDACVKLFRASGKNALIGSNPAAISPPSQPNGESSATLAEKHIAVALREGFSRFEWTHRRLDGEDFPAEVLLIGIQKEGKTYLHTVMRDLSEQKKAEAEIIRYREHLEDLVRQRTTELANANAQLSDELEKQKALENDIRQILDASGSALRVLDQTDQPIYANRLFKEELTDLNPDAEKAMASLTQTRREVIVTQQKKERDLTLSRVGDPPRNFIATIAPYQDADGKTLGVVENYLDVTYREGIRRLERQNAIEQGRVEMSNNLLHDIGNAVTGMGTNVVKLYAERNWSEIASLQRVETMVAQKQTELNAVWGATKAERLVLFLKTLKETLTEREERVKAVFEKLSRSISYVNGILNLQRHYARGSFSTSDRINLNKIVEDAVFMNAASFEKRDIRTEFFFAMKRTLISGDHTRLMQVLLNILKNVGEAFDAMDKPPEEKRLRIAIESQPEGWATLTFTDNAIGFDPTMAERFFSRGFSTKNRNSGFGLHECRAIIESHGGHIRLESPGLGKGSTMIIELPLIDINNEENKS